MSTTLVLKYWCSSPFCNGIEYWLKKAKCNYWLLSKEKCLSLCSLCHLQILRSLHSAIYSLKRKHKNQHTITTPTFCYYHYIASFFGLASLFNIISLTELVILLVFANHYFILFDKSVWQVYCELKAQLILALVYFDYLFKGYRYSPLMRTLKRNKIKNNLSLIHSCLSCSNLFSHYVKSTL